MSEAAVIIIAIAVIIVAVMGFFGFMAWLGLRE